MVPYSDLTGRISVTVISDTTSQFDLMCKCFQGRRPLPLHSWSSHRTGLLFAGKLLEPHSGGPTNDNRPHSVAFGSFKGPIFTFFFFVCFILLIVSGHLVIPQNVSSCYTLLLERKKKKKKLLQLLQSCKTAVWKPFRRLIEPTCESVCSSRIFCFF